jgi:ATP-binding cassette subfamily C protein
MISLPSLAPIAIWWRQVGHDRALRKVAALAALASLTDGFGTMALVALVTAMAPDGTPAGWLQSLLPTLPMLPLLAVVLLFFCVRLLVNHLLAVEGLQVGYALADDLRRRIHSGLLAAEWRWLSGQRNADHVNFLDTQVGRFRHGLSVLVDLFSQCCTLLVLVFVALLVSWESTAIAGLVGGLALLASRHQRIRAMALGHSIGPLYRNIDRAIFEGVSGLRLSKVLGSYSFEIAAIDDAIQQTRTAQFQYIRESSLSGLIRQFVGAAILISIIFLAEFIGRASAASMLPMIYIVLRVGSALDRLQGGWQDLLHATPAVAEIKLRLAELESVAEQGSASDPAPVELMREFRLENVTVHFDGRDSAALQGVSLKFPARTTTAITGDSGAGKSTLADVVTGLVLPDAGVALVDDTPLSADLRQAWRRSIAYVEQDASMRTGSIRLNLISADPPPSDAQMYEALADASAGFVLALPEGLDTQMGDNAVRLSGGERQRIALARALLRKPTMLILDEATNALDPGNEAEIHAALGKLRGRMTIIIITHGTSMLDQVDRIVRLEEGRLVSVRLPAGAPQDEAAPG